jgi:hypothetical protein
MSSRRLESRSCALRNRIGLNLKRIQIWRLCPLALRGPVRDFADAPRHLQSPLPGQRRLLPVRTIQ